MGGKLVHDFFLLLLQLARVNLNTVPKQKMCYFDEIHCIKALYNRSLLATRFQILGIEHYLYDGLHTELQV
jgi:hypothetical protein